jgi:pyruvate formate lyase activating enzyme
MDRKAEENMTAPPAKKVSRRSVVKYSAIAVASISGVCAAAWHVMQRLADSVAASVFKRDAPSGELWIQWKDRRWAAEARHYRKLGPNVQCKLCPNDCLLEPEDRGRCRNRVNKDGKMYTLAYANPCSLNEDPVEKKPLFHFLPGSWTFSLATSGCGFRCLNCQNWDISQRKPEETKDPRGPELRLRPVTFGAIRQAGAKDRMSMFPNDAVDLAQQRGCKSLAYTYSEPAVWYEYMYDTAKLAKARGVKNIWVTCGYINPQPLEELCEVIDAANVDLKGFDDSIYRKLNSGKLQPILDTLKTLKAHGVWFEITNLVVPTYTDDLGMIKKMCDWLVDNIGPDYPIHFSRFHPNHLLTDLPGTPIETLIKARDIAKQAGLRYPYIGNVRGVKDSETTFCPKCGKTVVERKGYRVQQVNIEKGACKSCDTPIAGVWTA